MARTITQEERQLLKFVEKLPYPDEQKNTWLETIREGGMTAELAEEIRQKLVTPLEGEDHPERRTRFQAELANIVRRWRLTSQSHNFGRK